MLPPCLGVEDIVRAKTGFLLICCIPALIHPGSNEAIRAQESSTGKGTGQATFRTAVLPILTKYCTGCHGPSKPKAGLNLASFKDETSARSHRKTWERIKEYVEGGLMPPDDRPQPTREEAGQLTGWIRSALKADDCGRTFDPGRVTIRRLNRAEYNNTIRDLISIDFHPADDFPSDDVGYGFDNIGDVLSMPPILLEKYLAAAELISEEAIVAAPSAKGMVKTWAGETLGSNAGGSARDDGTLVLTSESEIAVNHQFPRNAHYVIRVRACGDQAGPDPVRMAVRIDGKELKRFDVTAPAGKFQDFQFRQNLRGGPRRVSIAFLNDYYEPSAPDPKQRDRNLIVESIEVEGPLYSTGDPLPEMHRRIIFTTPKNAGDTSRASRAVLERFASRAYRRPVSEGELAKLMKLVDLALRKGDSFERGVQLAMQAILVSPQFLFRVELGSRADLINTRASETARPEKIGDFELANRLSYFLWSSMPDDELWRAALDGSLRSADTLDKQVRRMLRDPKAHALVENFAGQWLQLRNLRSLNPDRGRFPSFDEKLREAMIRETELFFEAVMRGDSSILEFVDSDFTYVNERLARHYGITGIKGEQFRRVKLKGHERGGLVTQASILTVTSNPTRTSPVKRGKWVLEQLLGTPPPPPPPNVPVLTEDAKALTAATLRLRMEQHRSKASCAVCHNKLDPLGFGLENFDAVGAWRDQDSGVPVDSSGTLPSGESFRGPKELKTILKAHTPEFTRCLTEKMLTYALGRGLEDYDRCAVEEIVKSLRSNRYRFSALVLGIVRSDPFQKRRG
jgi:mono/diheme cytochrome c family protein